MIRKFNENNKFEELNDIIDLSLAYVKDYTSVSIDKKDLYFLISVSSLNDTLFSIDDNIDMKDSLLTFFKLLDSFDIINVVAYDEFGNEYALNDDDSSYKYENVYNDINVMIDAIESIRLSVIYIKISI